MATLNIKNFPDALYEDLKVRADREGRSVAAEVTYLLAEQLKRGGKYTLEDWRGAGKKVWKGVDIEKFIDSERKSW